MYERPIIAGVQLLMVYSTRDKFRSAHAQFISVNSFYAGSFLHADDIRTLASNVSSMEEQVAMVQNFARQNLLRLNVQKCEKWCSPGAS